MVTAKTAYKGTGLAFYGENADYVIYENGEKVTQIASADFLDRDFINFMEARIKAGSTYNEAFTEFLISIGER